MESLAVHQARLLLVIYNVAMYTLVLICYRFGTIITLCFKTTSSRPVVVFTLNWWWEIDKVWIMIDITAYPSKLIRIIWGLVIWIRLRYGSCRCCWFVLDSLTYISSGFSQNARRIFFFGKKKFSFSFNKKFVRCIHFFLSRSYVAYTCSCEYQRENNLYSHLVLR